MSAMGNGVDLVALDMDGTLTQHKSPIEEANYQAVSALLKKYHVVMIGAGSCERIARQMLGLPVDAVGYYGMEYARHDPATRQFHVYEQRRVPIPDRECILRKAALLREKYGYGDFAGDSMEFHDSGMLTFALLGTDAKLADKLAFDPDRAKRRLMLEDVCEAFSEYTVFIGGSSSFDIVPKPYQKLFALQKYCEDNGFMLSRAIYFGDDYRRGGNDWHIFASSVRAVEVDDYRDFSDLSRDLLGWEVSG